VPLLICCHCEPIPGRAIIEFTTELLHSLFLPVLADSEAETGEERGKWDEGGGWRGLGE